MAFPSPTLAELRASIRADILSRLPAVTGILRRSFLDVIGTALAGAVHLLWGFLGWVAKQSIPDTAEGEQLVRWARIFGVERLPASKASGSLAITGTGAAAIPAGTRWRRSDGQEVESAAAAALVAGAAAVAVRAVTAGAAGNAAAGIAYSLVTPVTDIVSGATVSVALTAGADAESDDALQARMLLRIRQPPRGGAAADYRRWAFDAHPDVTRAWARPLGANADSTPARAGVLGTVTVYVMTDDATANGIPTAATATAVRDYIEARRPATADVAVNPPNPDAQELVAAPLALTIDSLTPDTPAIRTAIAAEIADLLRREAEPGGTILLSHIREAISTAEGETDHSLTIPAADVVHAANRIAVPGAITWT